MSDVVEPVLGITDAAREKILEVRAAEPEAGSLALWITVTGESGGAYTYDMSFRALADAGDLEVVQHHDDLPVVIDGDSVEALAGATLDFAAAGMVMQNPNRPAPRVAAPRPAADLSGPVAQAILQVLEDQINPAIASHGGRADLVAVEESIAYLRLSGGCQGCSMAAATLSQGIEVAILDAVPEITEVRDVTDHASGTNPYFESAKK
ncbi:MAG: iron-sulfur cluster assembly accessory protein [Actinobacteria bacterium]|jgi:Fe/S biogenesis protein NfuA|nr:iron-sulfur cluster assembly accessory protein [Actinomycetota bacterium]